LEALYGDLLNDEERDDIDTIGGLGFLLANRVPTRGELISHSSGIELEVLQADPRRIHRVRLRRLPARRAEDSSAH
ncbi:MAG: magnesium/cobalt efflux protein, partial [Rhodospirillaceae bacterium]|nr:magnesium/cobalt efflux protein [Rhodospirillaceae bacterium]